MGYSVEKRPDPHPQSGIAEDYRSLRLTAEPLPGQAGRANGRSVHSAGPLPSGFDWSLLGASGLWPL